MHSASKFWPTQDLDDYINLKTRVESRMALVDLTATAEDNILKTEDVKELISEDMKYRDQQLKRLKDEVLDLEDMTDSISLTDFTSPERVVTSPSITGSVCRAFLFYTNIRF